jgi:hypothetical protein
MITLITELILMGCLTYISYRYCNLVAAYDNTALLLENYKVWLANSENARVDTETALAAAYRTIDRMQDERDGTSFADDVAACIDDTEYLDIDENLNVVDVTTGFTYNPYASDVVDISVDRIQWTPQDLYTPDVNGSDEF